MGNRVTLVLALSANTELPGVVFRDVTVTPDVQMLLLGLGHGLQIRVDLKHESGLLGCKQKLEFWINLPEGFLRASLATYQFGHTPSSLLLCHEEPLPDEAFAHVGVVSV